ncbi:Alanine racemase [Thermodesulfobium narugense DSM 14796]|uniref:Alanine racemase n=1 Tax=Thermodesulfobium narugense DSM 14796 TaxID=747365 RepID=M1E5X7_9BACT|nr:alanine racemase [Thermodesulfobium narugense]AEE13888.1 Alanine racemase [Thermodesulfobium narugense DSM 14796]
MKPWLEIDLDAILSNYKIIKEYVKSDLIPVIKSNAYGMGLIPVANALKDVANLIAIGDIEEAQTLRRSGFEGNLLLIVPIFSREEAELCVEYNVFTAIDSFDMASFLSDIAKKSGKTVGVHVKVDIGMHRFGVKPEELDNFIKQISYLPNIQLMGIFSHFPLGLNLITEEQLILFDRISEKYKNLIVHLPNSQNTVENFESLKFIPRCGLLIYGAMPSDVKSFVLKNVVKLKANIVKIHDISAGQSWSYGYSYTAHKDSKIAVISIGYADGLKRALSNKWSAKVKGSICPLRGTINMNFSFVDITGVDNVRVGDEAILLDEDLKIEDMAKTIDTVPHEILVSFRESMKRIYV